MSQIIKLQDGGKVTPKNLQEYNTQKAKLDEEKRKKELDAESNSITINGKKYTRSEAKEKLGTWRGGQSAIDLRQSYGRRGRNVDSDYKRFLDMIDRGDVQAIDFNSDGGFDVKYATQAGGNTFNPSDKYSSDYLTNAIRSNLLDLSAPNTEVGTPNKISLDYNPQNMLLSTIWGGKLRQDTYNNMTERQRTSDVAKTLKQNRNKFAEYFTDRNAFNLSGELPFGSLEEYDQFVNDLESLDDDLYEKDQTGNYKLDVNGNRIFDKNKSTWSFAEQLRNRKFGNFWADYIFGAQNPQGQGADRVPPMDIKKQQEAKLRTELGLPDNAPLSVTVGKDTYIPSKEGIRDSVTNELFSGYMWLEPYNIPENSYLKQAYYNKGTYVGDRHAAEKLAQVDPEFRSVFYNLIEGQKKKFEGYDLLESKEGSGNYEFLNYLRLHYPKVFSKDFKARTEEITPYIDTESVRNNNSFINLYDPDYNPTELYQAPKYTVRVNSEGIPTLGTLKYENGFQVFIDDKGNKEILKSGDSDKPYPVTHTYRDFVDKYLYPKTSKGEYSFGNNNLRDKNSYSTQIGMGMRVFKNGGRIKRLQAGGNIYSGQSIVDKKIGTTSDLFKGDWSNLSAADKADLVALGLDITGLVSTAAVGVGNAVGAASGLGSTAATIYANAQRGDMSVGEQIGSGALNLAMDAATLVPGLGTWAKGAKTIRTIKRLAPVLRTAFVGLGLGQAANAILKATSDQEMTIDDWRQLASGLTALTSVGRQAYAKNKYTQKTLGKSKPITLSSDKNNYNVTMSESEIGRYNGLDNDAKIQFLRDKIKTNNPNITTEELNSINLNKKELLSPRTWIGQNKAVLNKSTVQRELKPETLENLSKNKYNWFEKGLIEERSFIKPQETTAINEKYHKLAPDTYGTVETSTNPIGRTKLGEGKVIKAVPESRQLNSFTAPAGVGEVQYKSVKDVAPVRQGGNESLYRSDAESFGRYQTMAEANNQQAKKSAKFANNLSETERKKEIKTRNIKKGKQEAEVRRVEAEKKRNVEETAKLGEKLQKDRARQREYQDIVNYNKQQKEAAQKVAQKSERRTQKNIRKEDNKKAERKTRQSSKQLAKGAKKTSKDLGDRIVRRGLGGVLRLAYGGPVKLPDDDYINESVNNSFQNTLSANLYNNAYGIKKNRVGLSKLPTDLTRAEFAAGNARPVSFDLSPERGVNLAITGDQYIEDTLANQGRLQKAQVLGGGGNSALSGIATPKTTYSKPSSGYNQFSTGMLGGKGSNGSVPLSTISSIASLVSKNNANNKIFNLLKKKLKPTVLDTPQDINYNIQGNEGVRGAYYRQAANLGQLSKLNQTSDADRQLAYNFNVAKSAAEARLQGDLANEQALAQSREKAFQVNASNLARREQVAGQNRASITDMSNKKAYLEAQKVAQNAQNKDVFLHDVTEQLKQRAGERQMNTLQDDLLTQQGKDFNAISSENVKEFQLQKAMEGLDTNSKEYNDYRNQLLAIQQSRLNRNLGYQKFQNRGTLRQVW